MKKSGIAFALAFLPALAYPAEPARVTVTAPDAAKFTDLRGRSADSETERTSLLERLQRHLETIATARLPAGQRLEVTMRDVDMAGEIEIDARGEPRRAVREALAPRIVLDFRVLAGDGTLACAGRRVLTDPLFLRRANIADAGDTLRHEKALLDDWVTRDIPCGVR